MKEILLRAQQIILKPTETWRTIKNEAHSVQELIINYAAPLALIPAVATLIRLTIFGIRIPAGQVARAPFMDAFIGSLLGYVAQLLFLLAGAWIIYYLAAYFNARSDYNSAFKITVYSSTPVWLLGIFLILPGLEALQIFGLYSIYLTYQGLLNLLETPPEKVLWYTVLIIIATVMINLILTIFIGDAVLGPLRMRMMAM